MNRFPIDVIVFAMLPDHGIWRETVSFVRCYVTMSLPMNGCAVPGKTPAIDPRQKWLPLNYSFVRIQKSLTNLVQDNKISVWVLNRRCWSFQQKCNILFSD